MEQLPSQGSARSRGDILVVDDNAANLVAVEAALSDMDVRVVAAQSGDEALRLLLERDFALILLDVKMPSMDGFETARIIRSRKRSRHTPIIFVTAHSRDDREVQAAYQLGAVDFMFKPILREVLQAKAGVFVELQRRTAEVARQAEQIREHERREHERALAEERARWEAEALRVQMEQLALADRRKDEFLAMLGHELRNPLVPIVTGLALLQEKLAQQPALDQGVLKVRDAMERQTQHLTRLVDDLLDIARINSGRIELRKSLVTIKDVVEQAVATSLPLIEQRGHQLTIAALPDELQVDGDSVRLVQAIANLLNNAARYTPDHGAIEIGCRRQGNEVAIAVRDSGRGIAPEYLPRLFDVFEQPPVLDSSGLGLGLALVKRLVNMHGGTVSAHSAGPGKGSEFVIELPLASSAAATPRASEAAHAAQATKANGARARSLVIALVEDNDDGREMMFELLTGWGHRVEAAKDGLSGADLIVRLKPDIALIDVGLPELDGYGVVANVRRRLGQERMRLVAMTGLGQESDRRRAREAGFDAHLVKPVGIEALQKVLSFEEA